MPHARPRIGVTRWEDVLGERIEDYWERVREAGGEPIDLHGPSAEAVPLDGLILTGGFDVVPARYGDEPNPKVRFTDAARDGFELALLADALASDLPVLAICRGHQVLNVGLGGRLLQHIEGRAHPADYRSDGYPSRWHSVRLAPGSRVRAAFGADEIEVNSRHHQGVLPDTLAPGLEIAATSPDGIIEGMESASHRWVVGVQWHPEREEGGHPQFLPDSRRLFAAFVEQTERARTAT